LHFVHLLYRLLPQAIAAAWPALRHQIRTFEGEQYK
jgi:hypothetical protein